MAGLAGPRPGAELPPVVHLGAVLVPLCFDVVASLVSWFLVLDGEHALGDLLAGDGVVLLVGGESRLGGDLALQAGGGDPVLLSDDGGDVLLVDGEIQLDGDHAILAGDGSALLVGGAFQLGEDHVPLAGDLVLLFGDVLLVDGDVLLVDGDVLLVDGDELRWSYPSPPSCQLLARCDAVL